MAVFRGGESLPACTGLPTSETTDA